MVKYKTMTLSGAIVASLLTGCGAGGKTSTAPEAATHKVKEYSTENVDTTWHNQPINQYSK